MRLTKEPIIFAMRILILGGGRFMGLHFSELAASAGHEVTQFVRGKSSAPPPNGVSRILGDRDGGLEALGDDSWDAVVDTSGYLPRIVKQSCDALRGRTSKYLFISTISVYADTTGPIDENSPRERLRIQRPKR